MEINKKIGQTIKELREKQGHSQPALAAALGYKVGTAIFLAFFIGCAIILVQVL